MPFFSIVMQSTLRDYPGAASERPGKLCRAIESVLNQSFQSWELIIVSDNCPKTILIADEYEDKRIKSELVKFDQADKWNTKCRNVGVQISTGKYILYLDNDDYFTSNYLRYLHEEITRDMQDWYICDHFIHVCGKWKYKRVELRPNSAGTANIIHSSCIKSRWPAKSHYGSEDWQFIRSIMSENKTNRHINLAGYCVCHIREKYDI